MRPAHRSGAACSVGEAAGDGEAEPRVGHGELGVAPVERVAGEAGPVAQVLPVRSAEAALAARPAQPGNADPVAGREPVDRVADGLDRAHDLVAQDERQRRVGELAVQHVQVGAAHGAGAHADEHLSGSGRGRRDLGRSKRPARGASRTIALMTRSRLRPGAGRSRTGRGTLPWSRGRPTEGIGDPTGHPGVADGLPRVGGRRRLHDDRRALRQGVDRIRGHPGAGAVVDRVDVESAFVVNLSVDHHRGLPRSSAGTCWNTLTSTCREAPCTSV